MESLKIGMIGAGQIARSHILAFTSAQLLHGIESIKTELTLVAEVNQNLALDAARKFGFKNYTGDWKEVTRSPKVNLVDIITPTYLHKDPAIDAADHHKDILCEKPLARNSSEAKEIYEAARRAGVANMVGFNYRRLPAISFCKRLVDEGTLGQIYHFRASFLEDWGADPDFGFTWRFNSANAGAGALADLGSHILDLARYLVGEILQVCGLQSTFVSERPVNTEPRETKKKVDVDDTTMCLLRFKNGAIGRIDASWCTIGRKVYLELELDGSKGSAHFNLERPNELQLCSNEDPPDRQGYKTILMGPAHPYGNAMVFPASGTGMGFEESLVNEIHDLIAGIQGGNTVSPSFYDGWKVNQIIDAILESQRRQKWLSLSES